MKKKKQEETKKTAESVNILESVPPTSPAPPKEAEKLDIFSIGDLSGLTLNNSTPATTTQTTNPVPAPGSFDLYGTKQPSYPQQFYQQPMQGVLPGVPYGYPYGQAQNMMPLNQIAYGGGYNGQSHVGATFQQSPASYPFNAGKPSSTVPITGANLYASPPTKWSTNSNGFVNINITVWMLSIDINLAQSSIWGGIPKCRTTKQKYSAHLFSAFICVACTLEHKSMTKDTLLQYGPQFRCINSHSLFQKKKSGANQLTWSSSRFVAWFRRSTKGQDDPLELGTLFSFR